MFERKIQETISYLTKETIGEQERVTSRQITAAAIPDALRSFFERDIDILVEEEKARMLASPHFEYTDDDMLSIFDRIAVASRDYAVFTAGDFSVALEKNVKLLFNYACRPQWTLSKYFFSDREHVPSDEIVRGMKYFWFYEYYRFVFDEYFKRKNVSVIAANKFDELIANVDQEVVRSMDSRKLAYLTQPLFELFNIGSDVEEQVAPLEALSIFYDDKNLTAIVERLDQEKPKKEFITLHDLVMIIGEVDYNMSIDISSIVNKHSRKLGVNPPEINVSAGDDFDVPSISRISSDPVDIGEGDRHLDFVISDEENGVIERDFDSVTETEQLSETISPQDEEDESFPAEMQDEYVEIVDERSEDFGTNEETMHGLENELESTDDLETEDVGDIENERIDSDSEMILDYDDTSESEEDLEDSELYSDEYDELASEEAIPEQQEYEIPELGMVDDSDDQDDDDARAETEIVIESDVMEIDWEKEAADIPDIDIDDVAEPKSQVEVPSDMNLKDNTDLKSAEELLSQLDIDDFEEPESKSTNAARLSNDIPLIEDFEAPQSSRQKEVGNDQEEEQPSASAGEVIQQYGDLRSTISASDKKKYIKRLFNRNEEVFNRAIAVLNGKSTWREASEYIDELFIKHDVDMYSRIAVQFTDDVYKRYIEKK